jgi:hypothetical protein
MQQELLNHLLDQTTTVNDVEIRVILAQVLEHLKLEAYRVHHGHGFGPTIEVKPANY